MDVPYLWGLQPLSSLAREVARRTPNDLHPLVVPAVPVEVKPLTEALNHLLGRLAAALQTEREFTADAAHELRNPLAGIKTQAQVAQRARDDGERDHALNQIVIGVDHATRLAEQLLSLARLDPDFSQGDFVASALRGRVGEMFVELESRAANRDVTLINEVPADLQLHANADAIDIALRNLLDNAIKHSASPGEVRVSARQCSPDFVELTIDDDGPGIPQTAHAQIPRRFTRLPGTLAPGSGLGFAIVARIAQLHRAMLRFSQRGKRGLCAQLDWPTGVNSEE